MKSEMKTMTETMTPLQAFDHLFAGTIGMIPGLEDGDLATEMAIHLGSIVPPNSDAPSILRRAIEISGKAKGTIAAIALAARIRIESDDQLQEMTDASVMPALSEEQKDAMLAEAERETACLTTMEKVRREALFRLRTECAHTTDAAAIIAWNSPDQHSDILARLLSKAKTDEDLVRIGAEWLAGTQDDDLGGGDGGDEGPDPEPGPRPPGIARRRRIREDA